MAVLGRGNTVETLWKLNGSMESLREAAELGVPQASYEWSLLLGMEEGNASPIAERFLRYAAEGGVPEAAWHLSIESRRMGNEQESRRWRLRAAELGHVRSMIDHSLELDPRERDENGVTCG
jgi:TPR repeat protein